MTGPSDCLPERSVLFWGLVFPGVTRYSSWQDREVGAYREVDLLCISQDDQKKTHSNVQCILLSEGRKGRE